jgi:phosphoribosylaminoimidazolecarboxamide formyltransferase/IMP cyclohydrolase
VPRALLSVYDKTGIVDFARSLASMGWELISSGGTALVLAEAGLEVIDVSTITGYPAILGHRVVTLHPSVHGAILADPDDAQHRDELETYGITPVQLVVVGLYPFSGEPSIELIDVGGPAMIRAAAKNHRHVGVVTDRRQFESVLTELSMTGELSHDTRRHLAREAFSLTASYDAAISTWLTADDPLPERITISLSRDSTLRYGENPHQRAARYVVDGSRSWWSSIEQLGGKEMSYLNVVDAESAADLVWRFDSPAAVIVKHANPCGVAIGGDIGEAYANAIACDPKSAFGGIVALNGLVDASVARSVLEVFTEVLIAPDFSDDALVLLRAKPNMRLLRAAAAPTEERHLRQIHGGFLAQTLAPANADTTSWQVVSIAQPTDSQLRDARLAVVTCAAVWSNAIVIAKNDMTVGIGGGQQSRVDAVELACRRAGDRATGAVAASDAFFPFSDGPQRLFDSGVGLIVQPGGSTRDEESIAAANEAGCVMLFTGERHFRH